MDLLSKLKGKPQDTWLESFGGIEADILAKKRTNLFEQAKTRYVELLIDNDIDDIPDLQLRGRKGNGAHKRLSMDLYELQRFVSEDTNVFPKETLRDSARYVTLKSNLTQTIQNTSEKQVNKDNIDIAQENAELKFKLVEKTK